MVRFITKLNLALLLGHPIIRYAMYGNLTLRRVRATIVTVEKQ